ncbi:hypothetical protein OKW22_000320 [Bacilli bacterium PM5-3]|nr:hypothetical protein [Bacilli bacterium PM5-3]MDH6604181.1 hypothetical protein [Bacilli bacterium PM5-9]
MKKYIIILFLFLFCLKIEIEASSNSLFFGSYNKKGLINIKSFEYTMYNYSNKTIIIDEKIKSKLSNDILKDPNKIKKMTLEQIEMYQNLIDSEIESLGIIYDAYNTYIKEFGKKNITINRLKNKKYEEIFYINQKNQNELLNVLYNAYVNTKSVQNREIYGLAYSDVYSVFGGEERLNEKYIENYLDINPNSVKNREIGFRSTTSGKYNGVTAASWAVKNAYKNNKEYRSYLKRDGFSQYIPYMESGDCTNFVSGAMFQGGLNMNKNWQLKLKSGKNLNSFKKTKMKNSQIEKYFTFNSSWFNANSFRIFWTDSSQKDSFKTRTLNSYKKGYFSGPKEADYYSMFKVGDIISYRYYNYVPPHNGQPGSYYAGKSFHTNIIVKKHKKSSGYKDWVIAQHQRDFHNENFYEWLRDSAIPAWDGKTYMQLTQID